MTGTPSLRLRPVSYGMEGQRLADMPVAVTGGAGFIGSALVERLLAEGARVRVIDSLVTGDRDRVPEGAELVEQDVRDLGEGAFGDVDRVYHLAALPDATREDPEMVSSIVDGTATVCAAAVAGGAAVVSISSALVYDGVQPPMRETDPLDPRLPYARAKAAAEERVRDVPVPSAILRPVNVLGPGLDRGIVHTFCDQARSGGPLAVWGSGEQEKSFVRKEDVVDALVRVPPDGRAYNVATEDTISVNRIAELVADRYGVAVDHVEKDIDTFCYDLDCSRLRSLGWAPSMDCAGVVRRMIDTVIS